MLSALYIVENGEAMEVSSKRLIEHAKFYDGKVVTYKGEAIAAVMNRGDYGWININDGDNAIGVWAKSQLLADVNLFGNYKSKGDMLEVSGIFNMACQEHGGDLDIHADSMTIKKRGYLIGEKIDTRKIYAIFFLFPLSIGIAILFRKRI